MHTFSYKTSERIKKITAMLSSDHDGEILAAVRALKTLLASEGKTFNDLLNAIEFKSIKYSISGVSDSNLADILERVRRNAYERHERTNPYTGKPYNGKTPEEQAKERDEAAELNRQRYRFKEAMRQQGYAKKAEINAKIWAANPDINRPVDDFKFNHRIKLCFKEHEIHIIKDLIWWKPRALLVVDGFGQGSLDELTASLTAMGLELGTRTDQNDSKHAKRKRVRL